MGTISLDYETSIFRFGSSTLQCRAVDIREIRKKVEGWKQQNPAPEPPLKRARWKHRYGTLAREYLDKDKTMSRAKARDLVLDDLPPEPDTSDVDYQKLLNTYNFKVWLLLEGWVHQSQKWALKDYTTLKQIVLDWENRQSLFNFIQDLSEITERTVMRCVDQLGFEWKGKPLTKLINTLPHGNARGSYLSQGLLMAQKRGITATDFMSKNVHDQSWILAVGLCDSWLEALSIQDRERQNN